MLGTSPFSSLAITFQSRLVTVASARINNLPAADYLISPVALPIIDLVVNPNILSICSGSQASLHTDIANPEFFDLTSRLDCCDQPPRALAAPRPGFGSVEIPIFW
jgi:hypothetical protein